MQLISNHEDGNYYYDEPDNTSVFQDITGEKPQFSAWHGTLDDRKKAARTPTAASLEEAVDFLRYQRFRCELCDKVRTRRMRKNWDDECKEGGAHNWMPYPPKKPKEQLGRKINMWFSNSQLAEVEKISAESGNDRASTIRELVALGLKCRLQIEKQ